VTAAPMTTACQADMRSTASRTSSAAIGISATSVPPSVECTGSRFWISGPEVSLNKGAAWTMRRCLPSAPSASTVLRGRRPGKR
jgi:hypothetical protein